MSKLHSVLGLISLSKKDKGLELFEQNLPDFGPLKQHGVYPEEVLEKKNELAARFKKDFDLRISGLEKDEEKKRKLRKKADEADERAKEEKKQRQQAQRKAEENEKRLRHEAERVAEENRKKIKR